MKKLINITNNIAKDNKMKLVIALSVIAMALKFFILYKTVYYVCDSSLIYKLIYIQDIVLEGKYQIIQGTDFHVQALLTALFMFICILLPLGLISSLLFFITFCVEKLDNKQNIINKPILLLCFSWFFSEIFLIYSLFTTDIRYKIGLNKKKFWQFMPNYLLSSLVMCIIVFIFSFYFSGYIIKENLIPKTGFKIIIENTYKQISEEMKVALWKRSLQISSYPEVKETNDNKIIINLPIPTRYTYDCNLTIPELLTKKINFKLYKVISEHPKEILEQIDFSINDIDQLDIELSENLIDFVVYIGFNKDGAIKFHNIMHNNKEQKFAFYVDDELISYCITPSKNFGNQLMTEINFVLRLKENSIQNNLTSFENAAKISITPISLVHMARYELPYQPTVLKISRY